jgi:hypothetical protein
MSAKELKDLSPTDGVRFLSDFRRPSRGSALYRVEPNGSLRLIDANFDSAGD